jgi:hypothetical protein
MWHFCVGLENTTKYLERGEKHVGASSVVYGWCVATVWIKKPAWKLVSAAQRCALQYRKESAPLIVHYLAGKERGVDATALINATCSEHMRNNLSAVASSHPCPDAVDRLHREVYEMFVENLLNNQALVVVCHWWQRWRVRLVMQEMRPNRYKIMTRHERIAFCHPKERPSVFELLRELRLCFLQLGRLRRFHRRGNV